MSETVNVPAEIPYEFDHGSDDGFALVATPTAATFRAKYMDFKQGDWLLGPEQESVPLGAQFVVHAVTEGWVRLVKGEPAQRIPREPNKPFPQRSELGDTDKSSWRIFDGRPSDPWVLSNELLMTEREAGQPVIFRTNSWSAREVVADLCRIVTFQRRQRGGNAKPIVAIGVSTRSRSVGGSYKVPTFMVIGWLGAEMAPEPAPSQLTNDLSDHLQARSTLSGIEATTAPQKSRSRRKKASPAPWDDDDLDDEIPL